jgi:hypothetical protein
MKGHGFSRAAKQPEISRALAPEGWFEKIQLHPSAAKADKICLAIGTAEAVPFQKNESFHRFKVHALHSTGKFQMRLTCPLPYRAW